MERGYCIAIFGWTANKVGVWNAMEWKPLTYRGIDFTKQYLISNQGDIYSLKSHKILKQNLMNGYLGCVVSLGKRGKQKAIKIHIAVAENFIPRTDYSKNMVNHKDGNKLNNHVSNLEWVSNKENIRHASNNNLLKTKKIKCINTGEVFDSLTKAAKWCGLKGRSPFLEYFNDTKRKTCGKHPITKEGLTWLLI